MHKMMGLNGGNRKNEATNINSAVYCDCEGIHDFLCFNNFRLMPTRMASLT